jgi:hypothetical protein
MTRDRWRDAAAVDVLALVLFVVIGRASHHHGETVEGIASTGWPFAVGLGAGWAIVEAAGRLRGRPVAPASVPAGGAVCVATVAVGMALRVVAGQGTAPAFVAVATGFLGAVMLAGRVVVRAAARRLVRNRS